MRAWRCHAFGDYRALAVESVPVPQPAAGEVRVAVRAIAPGFPDMLMVQGLYQLKPPLPFAPCADFSGVVAEVGEGVTHFQPGDRVMGVVRFGAAADFLTVKASDLLPLPARAAPQTTGLARWWLGGALWAGLLAAVVGGGLAVAGNTLLARFIFNLEPGLSWGVLAGGVLSVCLVTVVTGFLTNRGITRHPPLEVLRQET